MFDNITIPSFLTDERLILSVLYIAAVLVARFLLIRMIRGESEFISDSRRGWITQVRNGAFVLVIAGLALFWLPEISTVALSITAVAVALVIATKELILCFSGALYRTSARLFRVGDWIQIGPHFGEVVDHNWGATTLQEVDPHEYVFTGKTVALPNSMLLTHPLVNNNLQKRYVFHSFRLTTELDADLFDAIPQLTRLVEHRSADFIEVARRYAAFIEKRTGVDIPDPSPRFRVMTAESGKQALRVTVFCPRETAVDLQQDITRTFLRWYFASRKKPGAEEPKVA